MTKDKGETPGHLLAVLILSAALCSPAAAQQPQPRPPAQALATLTTALRLQNIALVDAGGVIRVVPEADARLQGGPVQSASSARGDEIVTQVFRLNYESAVSIAQVLRPLVASNNPINAYAGNNTIVVTDYAENVRRIARIIAAIDTPAGSEVDVIPLQYAIASDVALVLARVLEQPAHPGAGADFFPRKDASAGEAALVRAGGRERPAQRGGEAGRVSVLAEPSTN